MSKWLYTPQMNTSANTKIVKNIQLMQGYVKYRKKKERNNDSQAQSFPLS